MGWTSEMVAQAYKVSRKKQDEYALISHTRATKVSLVCWHDQIIYEQYLAVHGNGHILR